MTINLNSNGLLTNPHIPEATISIPDLPQDLLGKIFFHLSEKHITTCMMVDKKMRNNMILLLENKEISFVCNFIDVVVNELKSDKFFKQINQLKDILKKHTANNYFNNLTELKEYKSKIRRQLIEVLRTLDVEEMENINFPYMRFSYFAEVILRISILYKKVACLENGEEKNSRLSHLSTLLAEYVDIDEAIAINSAIEDQTKKDRALHVISVISARRGNIDRAIAIMQTIEDRSLRDLAINASASALAKRGDIREAVRLTKSIQDKKWRKHTFQKIITMNRSDANYLAVFFRNLNFRLMSVF